MTSLATKEKIKKLKFLDYPENRTKYHFDRAEQLLRYGKNSILELERILIEIGRASSLKKDYVNHYLALAECYRRAMDSSSAIFALRYVLKLDPTKVKAKQQICDLLIQRGQEIMTEGINYHKAIHMFDEALALDSSRVKLYSLKAYCFVYLQDFTSALENINKLVNIVHNVSIDIYILRAKVLWAIGLTDAGNRDMRLAMTINRKHPEVKAYIARSFSQAEKLYQNSIVEAHQKGNLDEAIELIKKALVINADDIKLHIMLSKYHRAKGDLEEAYKCLIDAENQFKKADPGNVDRIPVEIVKQTNLVLNDMALNFAVKKEYEKAITLINKAINSERNISEGDELNIDHKYFMNRGDCYRALGETQLALADYHRANDRCKLNWDISTKISMTHYIIAVEYFNQSNFYDAVTELSGSIRFNPRIAEYYALRGKAYYYQGYYHQAFEDYKTSLELNPNNDDIRMRIRQFEDKESNTPLVESAVDDTKAKRKSKGRARDVSLRVSSSVSQAYEDGESEEVTVSHLTSLLPSINPNLTKAMTEYAKAEKRNNEIKEVLNEKTVLGRGQLWSMVKPTKSRAMPAIEKKKTAKKALTAVALKRESQVKSKLAMQNPIIGGVVSRHDDPLLVAARSKISRLHKSKSAGDMNKRMDDEVVDKGGAECGFTDREMKYRVDLSGVPLGR